MTQNKRALKLTSFSLLLSLFCIRPGALGQNYTPIGLVLITLAGAVFLIRNEARIRPTDELKGDIFGTIVLWSIFVAYESVVIVLSGRGSVQFFINDVVIAFVVICVYGSFLANGENNQVFFRQFSTLIGCMGISCGITFVLFRLVSPESIHLFDISIKGYEGSGVTAGDTGRVYFPFSMLYQQFAQGLPRFCSFFTEAGIFQAMACFGFAYESLTRRSRWVRFGQAIAIVTSLSSMGLVLLAISMGAIYAFRRRFKPASISVAVAACVIALLLAFYTPMVGLADKAITRGGTITDRTQASQAGLNRALVNPLGDGFGSDLTNHNSGITLIASLGAWGFLGVILQAVLLSGVRRHFTLSQIAKVIVCLPLLLTALFSEPIAGLGMLYALVMVWIPEHSNLSAPRKGVIGPQNRPAFQTT